MIKPKFQSLIMKPITNPKTIQRRCFLVNCAKFTAGIALIGPGSKAFGVFSDSYLDYGYCIFKCPQPCSFSPSCPGCRDATEGPALNCTARNCALEKGLESCAHCVDLATFSKSIFVNYPNVRNFALSKQKEWGLLTAIDEKTKDQPGFKVYPTVTSGNITITHNEKSELDFSLYDVSGRAVKKGKINSTSYLFDISDLASGTYIINIIKDSQLLFLSKIMKK